MITRDVKAVYVKVGDISPVGITLKDKLDKDIHCPECRKGILYLEFESGKTKCTLCGHVE